ncbi:hypothetical protein, partial [Streptomyces sp. WM6378]|uniref:hypothetical protein n=1 Tax=Streptomyces sp. WM6378 TaxID=1415557 RepID=UPI0006C6C81A
MTALDTLPIPPNRTMEDRWTTPVWLGTLHPAADHDLLRTQMRQTPHGRREIDPAEVLDTD